MAGPGDVTTAELGLRVSSLLALRSFLQQPSLSSPHRNTHRYPSSLPPLGAQYLGIYRMTSTLLWLWLPASLLLFPLPCVQAQSWYWSLFSPAALAVDYSGSNLYVADSVGHCVDYSSSYLYEADLVNGRVLKLSSNPSSTQTPQIYAAPSASDPFGDNNLWVPMGVAVDSAGNVLVSANDVYKFSADGTQVAQYTASPALSSARGVAVDEAGNAYVANDDGDNVVKFSPSGIVLQIYSGNLLSPVGVAVDSLGYVYVSDSLDRISKFNANGTVVQVFTSTEPSLSRPVQLALDSTGGLYVADSGNGRVVKFSSTNGSVLQIFNSSDGIAMKPLGVAVISSTGHVYVADCTNSRIVTFAASGEQLYTSSTTIPALGQPTGIAVNGAGTNVFVSDVASDRIFRFSPDGSQLQLFSDSQLYFKTPLGLAVDGAGNVYVADSDESRVVKLNVSGGLEQTFYSSFFSSPIGVAVDGAYNVFITDNEHQIFKFNPAGQQIANLTQWFPDDSIAIAVEVDSTTGDVYISLTDSETSVGRIVKYSADGAMLQTFVTTNPSLNEPLGIALDSFGAVYAADSVNNRVVKFDASGAVVQILSTVGTAVEIVLDVAVDLAGNVFVSGTGGVGFRVLCISDCPGASTAPVVQSISPQSCVLGSNCTSELMGAYMDRVAFVLVAQANLSAELNITADLVSLPAVDPSDWPGSESSTQDWAALHGYLLVYSVVAGGVLSLNSTSLSAVLPAFGTTGYHRMLVVPITGDLYNLPDWVYVVSLHCTTLTTVDGACTADCPDGCFCTGDGRCWPVPGWWSMGEHSTPISCVLPGSCPGSLQVAASSDSPSPVLNADGSRNTQRCAASYTGAVCSVCGLDYYHDGAACRYCGSTTSAQVSAFVGLLIAAAIIASLVAAVVVLSSPFTLAFRVAVILALQYVVVIGRTAGPLLPSHASWLSSVFTDVSMLNLDVTMFHPGCVIAALSYVDVFWVTLLIVIGTVVILVLAAGLRAWLLLRAVGVAHQSWLWRQWIKRVPQTGEGERMLQLAELEDWTDPIGNADVRQQRLARHRAVLSFIFSWPSNIRADLAEGFELGSSSTLRWWPMARARAFQAALIGASLAYLRMTTVILQVLQCTSIENDTGTATLFVLQADKRTLCYQSPHQAAAVIAWMLLFLYCIGFPIAVLLLLRKAHSIEHVTTRLAELNVYQALVSPHGSCYSLRSHGIPVDNSGSIDPYADHDSSSGWDVKDNSEEPSATASEYDGRAATPSVGHTQSVGSGVPEGDTLGADKKAAKTAPTDAALELITLRAATLSPRYVQSRVSTGAMSDVEAAALDPEYVQQCTEMVLLSRFARFGYLLSTLRSDGVYVFAVTPAVFNFLFACLVVLPDALYVRTFVSALSFIVQCVLVALVWPFLGWISNVRSMAGSVALVLQALIALGIIQAVSLTEGSVDANSAHALSLQQHLASEVVSFLEHNLAFIGVLVALLCVLVVFAVLAARKRRGQLVSLVTPKQLDTYSTAAHSPPCSPSVPPHPAFYGASSLAYKGSSVELTSFSKPSVEGGQAYANAPFSITRACSSPSMQQQQQQQPPTVPARPVRITPTIPDQFAGSQQQLAAPPEYDDTYVVPTRGQAAPHADPYAPYAASHADPCADADPYADAANQPQPQVSAVVDAYAEPLGSSVSVGAYVPSADVPVVVAQQPLAKGRRFTREQMLALIVLRNRQRSRDGAGGML